MRRPVRNRRVALCALFLVLVIDCKGSPQVSSRISAGTDSAPHVVFSGPATHFGIVYHLPDGQADAIPGEYANGRFEFDPAESRLPIGQPLAGISTAGVPVQVVIDTENHEREFAESQYRVHLGAGAKLDSNAAVLFWQGMASARAVPMTNGTLDSAGASILQKRAIELHRLALAEVDSEVLAPHDTIQLANPIVQRLGNSGLDVINYQVLFRQGSGQVDERASVFFLYEPVNRRIVFGAFGHPEWGVNAPHVIQVFPRFCFTIDGDQHLYLVADVDGAWESIGRWVVFDAFTGQALTDSVESFGRAQVPIDASSRPTTQAPPDSQPRTALTDADLSIGILGSNPDTGEARLVLGTPPTVRHHDDRIDDELFHLTDWEYPGLVLTFSENGRLRIARITGGTWATHRGLRVGDSSDRVLALYGPPQGSSATEYSYQLPGDDRPSRLGLFAVFEKGRVTAIGIGLIVEGD